MSENQIHLKVISHENIVYESDINELYVQALDGRIGILPNHVPVVCGLDIGVAKTINAQEVKNIVVMGGILQFANNNAIILTDNAELDSDIDIVRAKNARERAEARLKAKDDNVDSVRAQIALSKAIARINARELKY